MTGRTGLRPSLTAGLLLLAAAWVATHLRVTTDITRFVPDAEDRRWAALSRQIADSELSRTMILALEAETTDGATRASRRMEALLRADPRLADGLAFLEGGPRPELERAVHALYHPRRLSFLAPTPEEARARLTDRALRAAASSLREQLRGPLSPLVARLAPSDPLLILAALGERALAPRAGDLRVVDGRFVTADGRSAILFLGTRDSALDAERQRPILAAIDDAFARLAAESGEALRLESSGVNRYAVRAASAIESDIRRVSIASSILLCALLLLLFRSLRMLALAAVPVGAGVVVGTATVLAVSGEIHGITLAFGAALISVSIDYVVHLYCHDALVAPAGGAAATLRALARPLATGCATTLAGFVALATSHLEGLREIAVFSIAGISAAFLVTLVVVPLALGSGPAPSSTRSRWVAWVERTMTRIEGLRGGLLVLPVAILALAAVGLPRLEWSGDVTKLGRMDADIHAEDERVRARVARYEQMRFVVAAADEEEEALRVNERVARALEDAAASGELEDYRSLATFLPSARTQASVAAVARGDATLPARWREAFEAEGFRSTSFSPFLEALDAPAPAPLRYDDLLASPLGPLVRPFRVRLGDRVALLTMLGPVADAAAIARRVDAIEGARLVDQARLMSDTQVAYQRSTARTLAWGLLGVVLLLALRYRDGRRTLAAVVPSLLAVVATISVLGLAGRGLDLISLTALVFIVSMGVDYGVFLVDARAEREPRSLAAALTGALLACGTTAFAFGLLARSAHPVLANLGLTAMIGVTTSLVLAPVALVLLGVGRDRGRP